MPKIIIKTKPALMYQTPSYGTVLLTIPVGKTAEFVSHVDAGGLSWAKISYNELVGYIRHGPEDIDENASLVSDTVYLQLLTETLDFFLVNQGAILLEGSIDPDGTFRLNGDFDLGDIVTVEDGLGHGGDCRITEVMYSDDSGTGLRVYPTFSKIE